MKICIDAQSTVGNITGVGRYTLELVKALAALADRHSETGREEITLAYFNFLGKYKGLEYFKNKPIRIIPGRMYNFMWKKFGWPRFDCLAGRHDIFHFPNFCLPPLKTGKSIITVHDLAFMRFPEYIEPKNLEFLKKQLPLSLKKADRIIAVSHFTKNEIIELFGTPEEKIKVIYEGVRQIEEPADAYADAGGQIAPLPDRYILYVGTVEPRKNIEGFIRAFKMCKLKGYKLIIAGAKGWLISPERDERDEAAEDVVFTGYVEDAELKRLYKNASLFVFPSFYEGFGFPPLEAMSYGVPVVSTKFEVLGDAARFIDPNDAKDIADGIMDVLNNPTPWRGKGIRQAAGFSWDRAAEETLALYRELC